MVKKIGARELGIRGCYFSK